MDQDNQSPLSANVQIDDERNVITIYDHRYGANFSATSAARFR